MTRTSSTPSHARLRSAVASGLAYLRSKQSDNGGFCFFKYRYLDRPNLRDSYYATTALRFWGCDIPRRDALVEFLKKEKREDVDGLFYFTSVLELLGHECSNAADLARIDRLAVPALNLSLETDRWFERIYRTLEVRRRTGRLEKDESLYREIQTLERQGGYGDPPNLRETRLGLKIVALLRRPPSDPEATRRFVDGLQHTAIGFADMPTSQYGNLEILSAGIECCALLHLPIRYSTEALTFVLACQSTDGSFSRVPVALPDIACTHEALQIIAWLVPDLAARAGEQSVSGDPGIPQETDQR
jgi:hypothetical protein